MKQQSGNLSYAKISSQKTLLKIRNKIQDLPICVTDFIRYIQDRTTPLTRLAYVRDLRVFFEYLIKECPNFSGQEISAFTDKDIRRISLHDLERYPEYLSLYYKKQNEKICGDYPEISCERIIENTESGIMRKLCSLRSFYKFLFEHKKIVEGNLAELIPLPKLREHVIIRLEPNEVARMLDVIESGQIGTSRQNKYQENTRIRDIAIVTLLLGTGIRVSECVGLNIDDLNFDENAMLITRKGAKEMILYFSDEVANALKSYLKIRKEIQALPNHEDALFLSLQRKRITQRSIEQLVKKYSSVAAPLKKNISPHKLRSTYGTTLYQETGDIYLVADVLGHSDVNTTRKHYAAMSDEKRRQAAKAVKLREDPSIIQQ